MGDLIKEHAAVPDLRHKVLSCCHISHRDAVSVSNVGHTHDIIVFRLVQGLGIHCGPRRDDPHYFSFDQALGCGRVLHLLTDSHFVSLLDQAAQVTVHCMIGHAAHGRSLFQAAVLSCQRDLQFPGCCDGILKKHLIKISQSIKQDAVFILFLRIHVLLHHGG